MIKIESAGTTDIGKKRTGNEDSYFIDKDNCLFLVADGMGGHNAGEVASKLVADTVKKMMNQYFGGNNDNIKPIKNISMQASWLISCLLEANSQVYRLSKKEPAYKGMGSTVSAVYIVSDTLIASNVGDSPIYLVRNNEIDLLSVPHTAMAEYAAFASADAPPLSEKFRHTITRAIGIKKEVEPDFREIKIFNGDMVLLCTDGLSDKVKPEELIDIIQNNSPSKACRILINLANERGGDDNITLIVLKIRKDAQHLHTDIQEEKIQEISNHYIVEFDTDDISSMALVEDFTPEGLFITTGEIFSMGQNVVLTISDEKEKKSVMVNSKVVNRKPFGVELKFEKLTGEQKKNITSLLSKKKIANK